MATSDTTPDPMDLISGTPEPAGINIGSPNVAISDIVCDITSYPLLGSGGVPNSFQNTTGIVDINYVTLTENVDGSIIYYVEDFNNKEELSDGETASTINDDPNTPDHKGRVYLSLTGVVLAADPSDGSMDVTVTLQQIINGEPYTKSLTKNISNPVRPGRVTTTPPPTTEPPDDGTGSTTTPRPIIQENLYTSGGEFILRSTGEEYIGFYHIHPDKGPMEGPLHIDAPHGYLDILQVEPTTIPPVTTTLPPGATTPPPTTPPPGATTPPPTPPPSTPPPSTPPPTTTIPPEEQEWTLSIVNDSQDDNIFLFAPESGRIALRPGETQVITKKQNLFGFRLLDVPVGTKYQENNFTHTAIPEDAGVPDLDLSNISFNGYITRNFNGSISIAIGARRATTTSTTTSTTTTIPPRVYCELPKVWDEQAGKCVCPDGFREDEEGNCIPIGDTSTENIDESTSGGSSGFPDGSSGPDSGLIRTGPGPIRTVDQSYTEETTTPPPTTYPPYYTTTTTTTSTTTSTTPYYTTPPPPCTQTTRRPHSAPQTRPPRVTPAPGTPAPPTPRPPEEVEDTTTTRAPIYPAPILPLQVPFLMIPEAITTTPAVVTTTTPSPVTSTLPPTTTICPEDPDCNILQF